MASSFIARAVRPWSIENDWSGKAKYIKSGTLRSRFYESCDNQGAHDLEQVFARPLLVDDLLKFKACPGQPALLLAVAHSDGKKSRNVQIPVPAGRDENKWLRLGGRRRTKFQL